MPPGIGYGRDIPIAGEGGANGQPAGGGNAGGLSPQEAVKILSLRVPERPSPTGLAPLPLLQSQGGMGAGAQGLEAMIGALIQAFPQLGGGQQTPWRNPGGPNGQRPDPGRVTTQPQPFPGGELPPNRPPVGTPPPRVTPGDPGNRPDPLPDAPLNDVGRVDVSPLPIPQAPAAPQLPNKRFPQQFPSEPWQDSFGQDIQSLF